MITRDMRFAARNGDSTRWYAINTNPRCEDLVYSILRNESFEAFLPKTLGKSSEGKEEPLFPGYLFVRLNLNHSDWVKVKYLHGVRRILGAGNTPVPVSEEIITTIKRRINDISCSRDVLTFKAGDRVRFGKGPFNGLEGIFTGEVSGKERVKVLLEAIHSWSFTVEARADEFSRVN